MRTHRLLFARAERAPDITRGADLGRAVIVVKRDGEPLLVPRSGPHLEEWNILVFMTFGLYRESLVDGFLHAARLPGIASSLLSAEVLAWARGQGHGVMVDPKLEKGRVVCGALAGAVIMSVERSRTALSETGPRGWCHVNDPRPAERER